jgi:hypothetical protein
MSKNPLFDGRNAAAAATGTLRCAATASTRLDALRETCRILWCRCPKMRVDDALSSFVDTPRAAAFARRPSTRFVWRLLVPMHFDDSLEYVFGALAREDGSSSCEDGLSSREDALSKRSDDPETYMLTLVY